MQKMIQVLNDSKDLTTQDVEGFWKQAEDGDETAQTPIKYHYMKTLLHIKPLYEHVDEETFYTALEDSVAKAIERGIRFQVEDVDSYMKMASQTYFKYYLLPETDTIHIPAQLYQAFSSLDQIFKQLPILNQLEEKRQINLLSSGFEYPVFLTRLLYYSFRKWKQNALRQVDIDLTVSLLPAPQRIEWEVFYEKSLEDVAKTIQALIEE